MFAKSFIMLGLVCLDALICELDFFIALPKFGAEHFGAPDDLKELVKKIPNKPRYVEVLGLLVFGLAVAGIIAVIAWAVVDTYQNYIDMLHVFLRFLIILWGYKFFDIIVFDWLLLTKIKFPEKMYPETAGAKGYDSFGFNAKSQSIKLVIFLAIAGALAVIYYFICR